MTHFWILLTEARNFKFDADRNGSEYERKNAKLRQRDALLEFWDPSILETIEARNLKFGIELDDCLY